VFSYNHDSFVRPNSRYPLQVCCSNTDIILPPLFTAWQTKLTPKPTMTLTKESRQVHEHWLLAQTRQGWLPKNIMMGYSKYAVSNQFRIINFHPASNSKWIAILSLEVKRPRREVDHSPLPSAGVTNEWSFTSNISVHLHGKHADNVCNYATLWRHMRGIGTVVVLLLTTSPSYISIQ
jgi:hypothetical protein